MTHNSEATLTRAAVALERMAAADEHRNELLIADATERRESWAQSQAQQARDLAALRIHPTDWLEEDDRLYWAIIRAHGPDGASTDKDEQLAKAILRELRKVDSDKP